MNSNVLKMAMSFSTSANALDPGKIETLFQYELVRNLFSRLMVFDEDRGLVVDAPVSSSTTDDSITFVFGDKIKTVDGTVITAEDAAVSLKRLIVQGASGHGDIRRFLCPQFKLASVNQACPGITTKNNSLILTVVSPHYLPLLIATLATADYSIIPISSMRERDGALEVFDYRNTSGPYYVAKDSADGKLELRANPNHYYYNKDMPQVIQIVPVEFVHSLVALTDGTADFVPTTQGFIGEAALKIMGDKNYDVHESLPIQLRLVRFSPKAEAEFSATQRLYVGQLIGSVLKEVAPLAGSKPTEQFFQPLTDGALDEFQLREFRESRRFEIPPKFDKPIELGVGPRYISQIREKLMQHPEIRVIQVDPYAFALPPDQRPDIYTMTNDSAWSENLSLIGYNIKTGMFNIPGFDAEAWFDAYISDPDKSSRIEKLKAFHYKILKNAGFVISEVASYHSAIRKPWRLNQTNITCANDLWRIRQN